MNRLAKLRVVIALAMRYMDDGRVFMAPFRAGWRWVEGDIKWCKRWEIEDYHISPVERTSKILHQTMNDLEKFLNFTIETQEDFQSGWLPTLDTDLRMTDSNRIEYKYYEKPMSSNVTLQKKTAMEENQKMKTLSNDLIRRLLNTSEYLEDGVRVKVIDDYSQKLFNSGFGTEQVRRIIINGISGYEKKLKESENIPGRKLHRTSKESSGKRQRKKLLGKSEWFKKKKKNDEPDDDKKQSQDSCSHVHEPKKRQKKLQNTGFIPREEQSCLWNKLLEEN